MIKLASFFITIVFGLLPKFSECIVNGLLPDSSCTPGDVETTDLQIICHSYTQSRRDVPRSVRRAIFVKYGLSPNEPHGSYEVDHLIPLELGGSNDISNLWPEAAPGYHAKDIIENKLHSLVCSGKMNIVDAQSQIAKDWTLFNK